MEKALNEKIRILVVDDHELVRHGITSLLALQPGYEVVCEAMNGEQAVSKAKDLQPDLVLMDMVMPRMNGLEAVRLIHEVAPRAEMLMISQFDSNWMVQEAIKAGARGYVLKSDAGKDLLAAVATVIKHKPFISPTLRSKLPS